MDVELSLAMETAEDRNEQRRLTRNNLSRKQTIVNLMNGLSSYVIPKAKNFAECDVSSSEILSLSETMHTFHGNYDIDFDLISAADCIGNAETDDLDDDQSDDNFNLINELLLSNNKQVSLPLHSYTDISTKEFCTNVLRAFRQTNLCKTYSTNMLKLIDSVENLFTKRKVCLSCQFDIEYSATSCFKCVSNEKTQFANIYDIDYAIVFSGIVERHIVDIAKYREKILSEKYDNINNDISFQKIYRSFLNTTVHQPFISTLIHLDGIPLDTSTKLTLWLLSCSILELPPHLRNQRQNMIILSMWVGTRQPIIKIWLRECIPSLNKLKSSGFSIRGGEQWFVYFLGLIGDCPAIKLALNHIGNNGYYSCWYCKIEGVHMCNKRQYHYEEVPTMRSINSYRSESKEAEVKGENINGHLGLSFFHEILDIPLPHSILMDYMHITLLRHTRSVVLQIYESIVPKKRSEIDDQLKFQQFPHTFNRKLKPIKSGHMKASEIKNLLLYGLVPIFYQHLQVDKAAHIALFVCAIRMLHGPKLFGHETGLLAHDLLSIYYKDHCKHYYNLENLIDFALQKIINQQEVDNVKRNEGAFDITRLSINNIDELLSWHKRVCDCNQIATCIIIYHRCVIKSQTYHSLSYPKRQSTNSYFVKYTNDRRDTLFGAIELFFTYKDSTLALINNYPNEHLFSDVFASSSYHSSLSKYINTYFYLLQAKPSSFHYVPIHKILNICVVFEKDDFIIVTPISQAYEHD
ncbi:unnamed protein product [Rotaria sp. Silwood1]|nr:unnamed protein product [Rotaria sp. Silwood1]CAF1368459.1 unnamed protein product [Rotaria sp. Silwood1]CAF1652893.1 unnamed protein product [Rotaria sp. Silwood1]CAF1652904.1 unnamed protein product [Rotaria sp. Silwood1]CAF3818511.1 unnamed protein product [Rotaria sp. Silwood1]